LNSKINKNKTQTHESSHNQHLNNSLQTKPSMVSYAPLAGVGAVVEFNFRNGGKTQCTNTLYLKVFDAVAAVVGYGLFGAQLLVGGDKHIGVCARVVYNGGFGKDKWKLSKNAVQNKKDRPERTAFGAEGGGFSRKGFLRKNPHPAQ